MSRGQAMVEFAIILPLLALLLVMTIDFGRVFFGWVALQNAARIAADHAAKAADSWPTANGPTETLLREQYLEFVAADLQAINCIPPDPPDTNGMWDEEDVPEPSFEDVDGDSDPKDDGDHAIVELNCSFDLITPLASALLGGPVSLGAEASFAINTTIGSELPSPVPLPTPTPVPTPAPGPTDCTVPDYRTLRANDAENLWDGSDFTGAFTKAGTGNFVIVTQTLMDPGDTVPCTSNITVSDSGSMTPAPTPSPTPVPTPVPPPTPTPVPTPTPCPAPAVDFTWAPTSPARNEVVQFTDATVSACGIATWNWNWGDGTPNATTQNPTHSYTYQGNAASKTFTIVLTVTGPFGTANDTQTITVTR